MEERIVIKGTPQKNKVAQIVMIVGIVLMFVSILVANYVYFSFGYGGWYYWYVIYDSFGEFFISEFFNISCFYGYMIIAGAIATIVGAIIKVNTEKCEIIVTNEAISGKLPHEKDVNIPLNQITAINPISFNGISVISIGNTSRFHCFENRDEVMKAISYLLANPQQATAHTTNSTTGATTEVTGEAEQLKRLKELLDTGVLTQEEFDAKKNQILGL